jgi:outer membrane protein
MQAPLAQIKLSRGRRVLRGLLLASLLAAAPALSTAADAPAPASVSAPVAAPVSDPAAINARFEGALSALGQGDARAAIVQLTQILARDPDLVRVRLELARALFLAGDLRQSKQQFLRALSARDLPAPVRATVLGFIRQIDDQRGYSSAFRLALTQPEGAGRNYKTDTLYFDPFGTGTALPFTLTRPDAPGIALEVEGDLRQLWSLGSFGDTARLSAYLRGHLRLLEARGDDYDEGRLDFAPGVQLSWPLSTLALELRTSALSAAADLTQTRAGLGVTYQSRNTRGLSWSGDLAVSHLASRIDDRASGTLTEATATLQQSFRGNGYLAASLRGETLQAHAGSASYTRTALRLTRALDVRGGLSLRASAFAETTRQQDASPGFQRRRIDHDLGVEMTVQKNDLILFNRFTPFVTLGKTRHDSSIAAFSYAEYRLQLGVESLF